ncbi:MAG: hypothetical protein ACR2M4_01505 [Actinomycetota bacterium]
MRQAGVTLREIQAWLNAQGSQLQEPGLEARLYYRAASRWADSGGKALQEFMAADGDELIAQIFRGHLEALDRLERTADGVVPLADDDGWMIPWLIGDAVVLRLIADVFPEDAVVLCEGLVAKIEGILAQFAQRAGLKAHPSWGTHPDLQSGIAASAPASRI